MPKTDDQDVKDHVMEDHDAGIGTSAEELETHNPDEGDFAASEVTLKTDGSEAGTAVDKEKESAQADDKGPVPYDRFQEVINERNGLKDQFTKAQDEWGKRFELMERNIATMERFLPKQEERRVEPKETKLPLDDVFGNKDPQTVLDALQADPIGFLQQFESRVEMKTQRNISTQREERDAVETIKGRLTKFADENQDFIPNLENIKQIISKDPAHNALSAYAYTYHIPRLQKELEDAKAVAKTGMDEAIKQAEARGRAAAIKEIRAKSSAAVLDGGTGSDGGRVVNPELQETSKKGGLRAILAQKLSARRAKE